jgi:hypothetical protein
MCYCAFYEGHGEKNTHLGEGVQNIPVPIILVKNGYVGGRIRSSKSFTDSGRNILIARCGVGASHEQVVLARRDLTNGQTRKLAYGRRGKDPHILHMDNEQPLLMHLIERFSLHEH